MVSDIQLSISVFLIKGLIFLKRYQQSVVPVKPKESSSNQRGGINKTALTTPFRLYEFTRMSFRLQIAAQTFQKLMHNVFRDLLFIYAHLDDILIISKKMEEYNMQVVQKVLSFTHNTLGSTMHYNPIMEEKGMQIFQNLLSITYNPIIVFKMETVQV